MRLLMSGTVAIVAVALLAACGSDDDADPPPTNLAGSESESVRLAIVTDDSFVFRPDKLEVSAGKRVTLTLENRSTSTVHDFTVERIGVEHVEVEGAEHAHNDELAMHVAADAGAMGTMNFVATEPGSYEFYCTVPGHREAGMKGTLTVVSPG